MSTPSTRQKMIAGAVDLIRRKGVNATSMRDVVNHTSTPRGSLSFHFPGGKPELIQEALAFADEEVTGPLTHLVASKGAVAGLRQFVARWRTVLEASNFEAGCPVLAIAVEPYNVEERDGVINEETAEAAKKILKRTSAVFAGWQTIMADALHKEGVSLPRAKRLATLAVASIEGTVAICRVAQNAQSLDAVRTELEALFKAAIAESKAAPPKAGKG